MHNPCLSHQPPPTSAVTRLQSLKKDGGVEQRSSLKADPAWPGHKKIVLVNFDQFSLYSIGTMIVQGEQ